MPVLGLAGCHWRKWKLVQVHGGDQSPLPPLWNSFVGTGIHNGPVPPANLMLKQEKREQPKEVLHLCRWSTHTHTPWQFPNSPTGIICSCPPWARSACHGRWFIWSARAFDKWFRFRLRIHGWSTCRWSSWPWWEWFRLGVARSVWVETKRQERLQEIIQKHKKRA